MIARELVVVAKHPEVGKVKTRLAKGIGDQAAYELYRAFIADIVTRFAGGPDAFALAYTPEGAAFDCFDARCFAQNGATLNARLLAIFELQRDRAEKTLVMSSDSPHVPAAWIARGFAALDEADVVLGPCIDGGYWCVGMHTPHDIFSGVAMSTPLVLAQTLELIAVRGLSCELLPTTFDVDELSDLSLLRAELQRRPGELPATEAALVAAFRRATA